MLRMTFERVLEDGREPVAAFIIADLRFDPGTVVEGLKLGKDDGECPLPFVEEAKQTSGILGCDVHLASLMDCRHEFLLSETGEDVVRGGALQPGLSGDRVDGCFPQLQGRKIEL